MNLETHRDYAEAIDYGKKLPAATIHSTLSLSERFDRRSHAQTLTHVADSPGAVHERDDSGRTRAARSERNRSDWPEHRRLRSGVLH